MNQKSQLDFKPAEGGESSPTERQRTLNWWWYYIFITLTVVGMAVVVSQVFLIHPFGLMVLMVNTYLYALLAMFLSPVFILFPATKQASRKTVAWYDILLFSLSLATFAYLSIHGFDIHSRGWLFATPLHISILSMIACLLILEAVRRAAGPVLFAVCAIFAAFPLYTGYLPGFLEGQQLSFLDTVGYHILGMSSILGIPMGVFGRLLCGFMLFGVAVMSLGGGKFFLNFAFALLGTYRGGPAKVAVVASSLFGSMSGSAISNVVTTGSMTIPAMKKTGYPPYYAGAIEACASTGGMLMPPVMGVTAFVMAELLGIPYFTICLAAAIPSILYYIGLFIQVDAYAAKTGIKGLERREIPSLGETLKEGWFYIFAIIVLVYFLYLRLEAQAPFYATGVLLLLAMMRKETRLNLKRSMQFIVSVGKVLAELATILAGVGFLIGSFSITGVGGTFAREVLALAGGNMVLMLIFGAVASYIMGMGMTVTACYIFLAIVLAPGLVSMGFNVLAIHLFVLYWGILSAITPPVAVVSFTAAGVAGASFFKTGFQSMRLAVVIYFIPFFFVFCPALVLQGSLIETIHAFSTAVIGIILLGGGLEGYLVGLGRVKLPLRVLACISGMLLMFPSWETDLLGIALALVTIGTYKVVRRGDTKAR